MKKVNITLPWKKFEMFTSDELKQEIKKQMPHLSDSSLSWHVHRLCDNGTISRLSRGYYQLRTAGKFEPEISETALQAFELVHEAYPFIKVCITETHWFKHFMINQAIRNTIILEVEKDYLFEVQSLLNSKGFTAFDIKVIETMYTYGFVQENSIILKPIISQSPLVNHGLYIRPAMEKLFVDFVADNYLYMPQEAELPEIMMTYLMQYPINDSTLLRYASRRNLRKKMYAILYKMYNPD